jgi:hypothetical protein
MVDVVYRGGKMGWRVGFELTQWTCQLLRVNLTLQKKKAFMDGFILDGFKNRLEKKIGRQFF